MKTKKNERVNEFKKTMRENSDEQLITIVTTERKSYKPEAIEAAEAEISNRNIKIDTSKFIETKEEVKAEIKQLKLTPLRKVFNDKYGELSESEIQKELLFSQRITIEKLEKIRINTSNLVWFLIVIPIILGILFAILN